MFRKIFSLVLVISMVLALGLGFTSCGDKDDDAKDIKVGFICLHDETSTYDLNFINAAKAAQKALGLSDDQVIIKRNIPESIACYETALDLVDEGCDVIFANSFGHESFMLQAAKENPDVQFCHATGTMAHTAGVKNFHNAFASIYEGRYLAGVAAGMKLNEMIANGDITPAQAKMGYVGAFTYAEVISGYTSFYLGAKSVCPSVTMDVKFTGSWFDPTAEMNAANDLISGGCVLISQHADSMGAPGACEAAGVPNVSYNGSTQSACPNTYIVSSRIDWQPYFELMIKNTQEGKDIPTDYCGDLSTGSVKLTDVNTSVAAEGTVEAIEAAKAKLMNGELNVFDTANFTKNNVKVTSYKVEGQEVIKNGVFDESGSLRSAPYFDIQIDGIRLLNTAFGD